MREECRQSPRMGLLLLRVFRDFDTNLVSDSPFNSTLPAASFDWNINHLHCWISRSSMICYVMIYIPLQPFVVFPRNLMRLLRRAATLSWNFNEISSSSRVYDAAW